MRVPENVYGKERFLASRTESPETSVGDPDPDPQDPHVFGPSGFKTEDNVPASSYKEKYGENFFFYILHVTEERSLILQSEVWIRESGSAPKCHGSPTLPETIPALIALCC